MVSGRQPKCLPPRFGAPTSARFGRPPLSDSEGIFQISCQSLTNAFPFSQESRRKQKKQDPFCTKTRLTRYLRNQISQNCTKESQKWLYSLPAAPFWGTNLRPASAAPFWGANVCRPAGCNLLQFPLTTFWTWNSDFKGQISLIYPPLPPSPPTQNFHLSLTRSCRVGPGDYQHPVPL